MSPLRPVSRILFVLLVILLGSTQLYGQSLSASPSQVVAGSTQSVTVTWSCAAGDSGCAPNWNQFAFPVYFGGNGSLTLYPGWVNCGGDPPNPSGCPPYVTTIALNTGGQQFTQTVAISPNQITITAAPTQFASGSQIITVQGSLSAPLYQQRTACPFVYTQGAPGTSLLNIDYSVWTCVNIPAGQSSFSQREGTLTLKGNQTVTNNYLFMQIGDNCGVTPLEPDSYYINQTYCGEYDDGVSDDSTPVFLTVYPQIDPGPCDECEAQAGQPINLTTGDIWTSKTDYSVPGLTGGLSLSRTWNSLWNQNNPPFSAGMFGIGWTSSFEERLQVLDAWNGSFGDIKYWLSSGNTWVFYTTNGSNYSVAGPPDQHATLSFNSSTNVYTLRFADGTSKIFNGSGYLTSIVDRNNNTTTLTYDGANRITTVAAPGGQSLTFTYGNSSDPNRVTSVQDSVGNVTTYTYSNSLLTNATY